MPETLRGPIGLLVSDARTGDLDENEIDVGRNAARALGEPLAEGLTERIAAAGRGHGLWLTPHGRQTHPILEVGIGEARCRFGTGWECGVDVVGRWIEPRGDVTVSQRWTGSAAAMGLDAAVGAALDDLVGAMAPWLGALDVQWAAHPRPAPPRVPAVIVHVRDGGGRPDLRLGAWREGPDRCVVERANGELRLVQQLDVLDVTHVQVLGVEPGSPVRIARAADQVVGVVGEWDGRGWYVVVERGLMLVPYRALGPRSRLPPPNQRADVCGAGADISSFSRSSETSYVRSHLTSSGAVTVVEDLRARPKPEARAAFHGGIGMIVAGGLVLATSFIAPIDGCYQVEEPCNSYPAAPITVPVGIGLLSAGIPAMVTGAARGGARPR